MGNILKYALYTKQPAAWKVKREAVARNTTAQPLRKCLLKCHCCCGCKHEAIHKQKRLERGCRQVVHSKMRLKKKKQLSFGR